MLSGQAEQEVDQPSSRVAGSWAKNKFLSISSSVEFSYR